MFSSGAGDAEPRRERQERGKGGLPLIQDLPEIKRPDNRCYTIKLIPHHGDTIRSISLPIHRLKKYAVGAGIGAGVFLAALGFATYGSFTLAGQKIENRELKAINASQQAQISDLARKANNLQDQITEINRIEAELRQLSGVNADGPEATEEGPSFSGQGGPYVRPSVDNISKSLASLEDRIQYSRARLGHIRQAIEERNAYNAYLASMAAVTPSIWPAEGDVSSPYGMRWGGSDFHPGIDIANDYGTPIMATADGYVTEAGWDSGGYGNKVDIDHGNGVRTRYGHAQSVIVSAGESVKKGQVIAYMGSTGFSTGPHVHYEVNVNGEDVNPFGYMK